MYEISRCPSIIQKSNGFFNHLGGNSDITWFRVSSREIEESSLPACNHYLPGVFRKNKLTQSFTWLDSNETNSGPLSRGGITKHLT